MPISQKMSFLIIIIILIFVGCAHIPKSDYPLEIERSFPASFDKTWDSVLEIVKTSKGTIITNDKASGLIVYSIIDKKSKSQVYMNVYLKNEADTTTNITVVHLIPWVRTGYYLKEIDKDFFTRLEKAL